MRYVVNVLCHQVEHVHVFVILLPAPRFMSKHGDPDLQALVESTVPPCDLTRVALFHASMSKYEKQAGFANNIFIIETSQLC